MIESTCTELAVELKDILHVRDKSRTHHGQHRFSVFARHIVEPVHDVVEIVIPLALKLHIHI